ncbi:hypothetical protein NKI56_30855 [Mesorhizobium sp. M0622]|uniref:hypothetical protein n=1 Tax=unclassified Mesorhizobium TaxID=325217 RepID=UPI00333CB32F
MKLFRDNAVALAVALLEQRAAPAAHASSPAEPERTVCIPGDGSTRRYATALQEGFDIEPKLWAELSALSHSNPNNTTGLRL